MSTHIDPAPRHASPAEPTIEPDTDSPSDDESTSAGSSYSAHDAAATFDTGCTARLPNTVDDENSWVS